MAQSSIVPFNIYRALAMLGNGTANVETLAATKTLIKSDAQFQLLDPGGAGRNVDLPAEETSFGFFYVIANKADAAEAITVRNDAAGTVQSVGQNEVGIVINAEGTWVSVGVFSATPS